MFSAGNEIQSGRSVVKLATEIKEPGLRGQNRKKF
jgi:hypothetical protein